MEFKRSRLAQLLAAGSLALMLPWSAQGAVCNLATTATCDLRNALGDQAVDGIATYTTVGPQSTGTGVLDSFVQISPGGSATTEQAYNTTANGVFNNVSSDQHNHELTIGQVGFVDLGGGNIVMRFVLDINQTGSSPNLSLNDVQLFVSTAPNQSTTNLNGTGQVQFTNSQLVYRLDGAFLNTIYLNYLLNNGSGSGDVYLDISASAIDSALASLLGVGATTAQKNGAYIYLYSSFGSAAPFEANDGFEEWGFAKGNPYGQPPCTVNCGPQEVPEPTPLSLLGLAALIGAVATRRRRRA